MNNLENLKNKTKSLQRKWKITMAIPVDAKGGRGGTWDA